MRQCELFIGPWTLIYNLEVLFVVKGVDIIFLIVRKRIQHVVVASCARLRSDSLRYEMYRPRDPGEGQNGVKPVSSPRERATDNIHLATCFWGGACWRKPFNVCKQVLGAFAFRGPWNAEDKTDLSNPVAYSRVSVTTTQLQLLPSIRSCSACSDTGMSTE